MGVPLSQMGHDMEQCPHEDKIAELVNVAKDIKSDFADVREALIGSLDKPGSGALVRIATLEEKTKDYDDVRMAAKEWGSLKKWGIGVILAAAATGAGSGRIASYVTQNPPPAVEKLP